MLQDSAGIAFGVRYAEQKEGIEQKVCCTFMKDTLK